MVRGWGWWGADLGEVGKERTEALLGVRSVVCSNDGRVSRASQCFLNAVLQCLSSTRPLRDFCLRRDFRQEVPGGGRAQELTEGRATPLAPPFPGPLPDLWVRLPVVVAPTLHLAICFSCCLLP